MFNFFVKNKSKNNLLNPYKITYNDCLRNYEKNRNSSNNIFPVIISIVALSVIIINSMNSINELEIGYQFFFKTTLTFFILIFLNLMFLADKSSYYLENKLYYYDWLVKELIQKKLLNINDLSFFKCLTLDDIKSKYLKDIEISDNINECLNNIEEKKIKPYSLSAIEIYIYIFLFILSLAFNIFLLSLGS